MWFILIKLGYRLGSEGVYAFWDAQVVYHYSEGRETLTDLRESLPVPE